ncbi:MAG: PDZ domain-containing protein, partial [Planctomycetaceae bacterium]|nr:PDZ domain-containing protein [Planctomycetaceae bacterium]
DMMIRVIFVAMFLISATQSTRAESGCAGENVFRRADKLHMLFADVEIDGKQMLAVIDTGATHTIIHGIGEPAALTGYVTKSISLNVFGRAGPKRHFLDVPIQVGDCGVRRRGVIETDLSIFPSFELWKFQSFVGMNYLRDFSLKISYKYGHRLFFSPVERIEGEGIPLVMTRTYARIPVRLAGEVALDCIVDTGMDDALALPPNIIQQLERLGHIRKVGQKTVFTGRGPVQDQRYILRVAQLGKRQFQNIPVGVAEQGYIGLRFFDGFDCLFDFPRERLYLNGEATSGRPMFPVDASGLGVAFGPDLRASVRKIESGYPASTTRIQVGDRLLELDGVSVEELSILEIRSRLSQAGSDVTLTLESKAGHYNIDLPLDRPYEYPPKWEPEDPHAAPRPFPNLDEPAKSN